MGSKLSYPQQFPAYLTKECTSNHLRDPTIIYRTIMANEGMLEGRGALPSVRAPMGPLLKQFAPSRASDCRASGFCFADFEAKRNLGFRNVGFGV